jgi:hypothetical protein
MLCVPLLVIVPFVGGLWNLSADFIKQTDFWKGKQEAIATLSAFGVKILLSPEKSQEAKSMLAPLIILLYTGGSLILLSIAGFFLYQGFLGRWGRKAKYQQILRFLQWAEHDIEEAQQLRIRSPHMIRPGSPES